MTTQLILNHLKDTRNRSIKIWNGIPSEKYLWKPDFEARHLLDQIRHMMKADRWFHYIIKNRGDINDYSVFTDERPFTDLQTELDYHKESTEAFWNYIADFSDEEMNSIKIFRTDKKGTEWERPLGEYLMRVDAHEAIHIGQIMRDMRQAGIGRPDIWSDEEAADG